jgi:hypothetical protein
MSSMLRGAIVSMSDGARVVIASEASSFVSGAMEPVTTNVLSKNASLLCLSVVARNYSWLRLGVVVCSYRRLCVVSGLC